MANANITKKALAQSLKNLGAKKILDKITVADITDDCGVNRQTFYYHFTDKYELLAWIYTQDLFIPLTADLSFDNWPEKILELLKYMKSEKKFIINTIKSSNNFFAEYLEKVLIELFNKAIADFDLYNNLDDESRSVYARFFTYGLCGVIVDWAMEGMKQDEQELAKTMETIAKNTERMGHEFYIYHKQREQR
ncbi:MAG: TetR/AcrR family transcriptional regulator C-terminal domain-containing protein [Eubacterium sp.]|nr:TetR/AcrR family transcriptional regulator C-terminal domain-containing protein [Eubacterium sp.]